MGELLDREFQRVLLGRLASEYPQLVQVNQVFMEAGNPLAVNLAYLEEHGLLKVIWSNTMGEGKQPVAATISARGLDFLADDGGLSAILGVVTVRLHDETIRDLLIAKIAASEAPNTLKDHLITKIKVLPADVLGSLVEKALNAGLDQIPGVADWLASQF